MKQNKLKKGLCHNFLFRRLMIMLVAINLMIPVVAQQQKITGTITDGSTGETMPGVNVLVEGTTIGVISDAEGKFSIQVPNDNAVLIFSFVGYITEQIPTAGQTNISVKLSPDIKKLDEVIVVGYGTQRKEAVTGSVASVKSDVIRDMPAANITQAIQGRVAGVDLESSDTKPGAALQIRIRGQRSLNASNDPLVVLDGIPFAGSIGDLNPSDIKSLDILKDASATAIYGSRGANGVILVTTNKGSKGQKARITYDGYYGIKKVFAKYPMMNGDEFVALRKATNGAYKNTVDEADSINTDWQNLLYKTGMVTNHDLNISGGTEKGSYNVSGGYQRDEAVVPLQNYNRYTVRASVDQEIGKLIRIGFSTANNYSVTNGMSYGSVGAAISGSPIANPYKADGTLKNTVQQATGGAVWVSTRDRIETLGDKYIDQTRAYGTYNSMYGEVKIPGIDGLKYRLNLGLNYRQNNYGNYVGQGVFSGNPLTNSSAVINNSHTFSWTAENLITYDKTFAGKHKINFVGMYSAEQQQYFKSQITAQGIQSDDFQFYNMGRTDITPTVDPAAQAYTLAGLESYMARIMYSFNDKYMISATVRSDGSSRLAPGHKWHTYPAVSVGWNLKEESFMKDVNMISNLKLRVGYGETSNQSIDPYSTLGVLSTRPYNFGDQSSGYITGGYVSTLPNAALGWEYSKTWNYGVDFALFKNRLTGSAEYYVMNTDNVLLSVGLPPTSGVGSYMANIGKTQNKGVEVSLNGVILDNVNGITWEVGANVYANRNKLVALNSGQQKDEGNWWFVGHSINVIFDYKYAGLWQASDPYFNILEPGGKEGMIRVKYDGEYNPDGSPVRALGADDREVTDMDPNWQGGFNTRIAYKGLELSVIGSFQNGGVLISQLYGPGGYLNNLNTRNGNNVRVDYWTPTNTGARWPAPNGPGGDNPKYESTLSYFNGTYLRIRNITLGYNIPVKFLKGIGIDKLRIYGMVQNPFVFFSQYKNISGMDPETNSYANQNASVPYSYNLRRLVTIGTNTPTTRNYVFGINLTF